MTFVNLLLKWRMPSSMRSMWFCNEGSVDRLGDGGANASTTNEDSIKRKDSSDLAVNRCMAL
jgi:hypothetical protein